MKLSTKNYDKIVNKTRSYLRSLSKRRSSGVVTADDANSYLATQGIRESRISDRKSIMNSIFRHGDFTFVGKINSTRAAARGRSISMWEAGKN